MSQQLFEIQPCANCKHDAWQLGPRPRGRQEFTCFYCGAVIYTATLKEDR